MAKSSGRVRLRESQVGHIFMKVVSVSRKPSERRKNENLRLRNEYAKTMIVEDLGHPNGAFFAYDPQRKNEVGKEHELTAGRIVAKNGLYITLDKEGKVKIQIPGRSGMRIPSGDGVVQGFSHDIYGFKSHIDKSEYHKVISKVITGITHSYKPFRPDLSKSFQADVALTIATKDSNLTIEDINNGVAEFIRGKQNNEYFASPKLYIHVSEADGKVYYFKI